MVADFSVRAHRFLMYISSLDFPFRVFGFCRGFAFKFNFAPFAATACHSDFGRSLARHAMVCLTLCCIANLSASALETLVMAQQQLTFCRTTALMAPKILPRPKAGTLPPSIQRPTVGNGLAPGDFVPNFNFSCYSYWISVELLVQLLFSGRQAEQLWPRAKPSGTLRLRSCEAYFSLAPLRRLCLTLRENFGCSTEQYTFS